MARARALYMCSSQARQPFNDAAAAAAAVALRRM
jgi:hypothetical protein